MAFFKRHCVSIDLEYRAVSEKKFSIPFFPITKVTDSFILTASRLMGMNRHSAEEQSSYQSPIPSPKLIAKKEQFSLTQSGNQRPEPLFSGAR